MRRRNEGQAGKVEEEYVKGKAMGEARYTLF
jgi:hypothetical protein